MRGWKWEAFRIFSWCARRLWQGGGISWEHARLEPSPRSGESRCGPCSTSGLTPPHTGCRADLPAPCAHSHSVCLTGTIVAVPAHAPKRLFCILIASVARLGFVSGVSGANLPVWGNTQTWAGFKQPMWFCVTDKGKRAEAFHAPLLNSASHNLAEKWAHIFIGFLNLFLTHECRQFRDGNVYNMILDLDTQPWVLHPLCSKVSYVCSAAHFERIYLKIIDPNL